jgi:hypothetical protein
LNGRRSARSSQGNVEEIVPPHDRHPFGGSKRLQHDQQRQAHRIGQHGFLIGSRPRTRLSDREDPVPDNVWEEAARHYDEAAMAALLISIATINVWNRFNVATRQVAGMWRP